MTEVWAAMITEGVALPEDMPPVRRRRCEKLRQPLDIARASASHYLLAEALASFTGTPVSLDSWVEAPSGKPRLAAFPELCFNLAHTGRLVVCAVSLREVGVDAEQIRPMQPGVRRRFMAAEELSLWEESGSRAEDATAVWCRKESYGKAMGCGVFDAAVHGAVLWQGNIPLTRGEWTIYPLSLPEGYAGAVCTQEIFDPEIRWSQRK